MQHLCVGLQQVIDLSLGLPVAGVTMCYYVTLFICSGSLIGHLAGGTEPCQGSALHLLLFWWWRLGLVASSGGAAILLARGQDMEMESLIKSLGDIPKST